MKYNSIGEQLIAKAQELDPNYKPDKFNDMSEAIDVILNNSGSGSAKLYLDIMPYITQTTELNGTITQEGFNLIQTKLDNGEIIGINMGGTLFSYAYFNTYSVDPSEPLKTRIIFLHNAENEMYLKLTIDEALTWIAEPEPISSGGQSIEDLPVVELTSETTTITDETVKAKILENVNKDNYLICKLKIDPMSPIEILITRDAKLVPNDTIKSTVFTQTVFIDLGIVAGSLVFTLSINSEDGTIAIAYAMLDYIKGRQIALIQPTNESFGVTADYGDTNLINGLELYFDTINGKPIIHSDNTVNSYTFTEDKTISLFGKYSILVPNDSADINILPLPSDASSKTYTLKAVNGVLTWVEG